MTDWNLIRTNATMISDTAKEVLYEGADQLKAKKVIEHWLQEMLSTMQGKEKQYGKSVL